MTMEFQLLAAGFVVGVLVCGAVVCYLIIRGHNASVLDHKERYKNET